MTAKLLSSTKLTSMSEQELYSKIGSFLERNYLFVTYDLPELFGSGTYWANKLAFRESVPDLNIPAEELWHEGHLEEWHNFTKGTINMMYDEFVWQCLEAGRMPKKRLIKTIISDLITTGKLTKRIIFSQALKEMMAEGRTKVARIRPLAGNSNRREKVELGKGDRCYFSWHKVGIANPALVYSSNESFYRLLFFTNCKDDAETSKKEINYARFLTVPKDQLGLSPKQAVLQKYY